MKNFNKQNFEKGDFFFKKIATIIIFTFVFSSYLSSCISLGKNFPHINVKLIKTGETAKGDIRKLFGSPWLSGINDGELAWTYGNYDYSLFGDRKAKDLVIQFDENGVVTTYTYSTTEHND